MSKNNEAHNLKNVFIINSFQTPTYHSQKKTIEKIIKEIESEICQNDIK